MARSKNCKSDNILKEKRTRKQLKLKLADESDSRVDKAEKNISEMDGREEKLSRR